MATDETTARQREKGNQEEDNPEQGNVRDGHNQTKEIRLDKWQKDILEHDGHLLLCTGRQVGKTTIFATKAAEYMVRHPGSRIIVVSLTEDQAELIIVMTLNHLEKHYKPHIAKPYSKTITKKKIILKNKSQILARPVGQTGDAVRGFTGDVLIIDEASKMPESVFTAARPTLLTTGGQIWMCSTPFGKQGYFYRSFLNRNKRFFVKHISSEEVIYNRPIGGTWTKERSEENKKYLEEEKADMSQLEYGQEYLGKFMEDLQQLFSDKLIDRLCRQKRFPQRRGDYFMGVDIARLGLDESAFQVIKRIDRNNLIHVESVVTRKQLTTQTFDRIINMEKQWCFRKIGIDAGSGSLGVGIFDFLLREPIVKRKIIDLDNAQRMLDHLGERTGRTLKVGMYANLLMLMEKGRIKLLDDENVRLSLKSVQYEYIIKPGQKTQLRIFSVMHKNADIVEGLTRAAWLANQKHLNTFIGYI